MNRVPSHTPVLPSENQSCQMQTMNDSRIVVVDTLPSSNDTRLKPIQEENLLINDSEQPSKRSMNEETSSVSSLFSDTVLNICSDESKMV